jgi:ankyrin repeat protein
MLLAHAADVDARNSEDHFKRTPLHWAAQQNSVDSAKLLLAHGADVNGLTSSGDTPLTIAKRNGRREIEAMLLQHGECVSVCVCVCV